MSDQAPTVSGLSNRRDYGGSSPPLRGVRVSDAAAVASGQTISVTLTGSHGIVATTGKAGTIAGNGTATMTISGSLSEVNSDLTLLTFTGSGVGAGVLQAQVSDGILTTVTSVLAVKTT